MSRRSESVRGLMPGQECSSCMNRLGPSERSWTMRGVHFVAMISAVAATAHVRSCCSCIVRFMRRIPLHEVKGVAPQEGTRTRLVGACQRITSRSIVLRMDNTVTRTWSKAGGRWTDELVAYGLDVFHRRNLRTPTVRELRAGVE